MTAAAKITSKRIFEPLSIHEPPSNIEGRPASAIARDCFAAGAYQKPLASLTINENSLIETFQNGCSKGFVSGLAIALEFIETYKDQCPELARSFGKFVKESTNEQLSKK